MIEKLISNPRKLFLIDGLGAFLTVFFLLVLSVFQEYFGIPKTVLDLLSLIAVVLGFYSLTCFFALKRISKPFLRIIMVANLVYCVLSLGLVIYYYSQLTVLGVLYFSIESAAVVGLVFFENYVWERNKCFD